MLALPIGFPLKDFIACTDFATYMLQDKNMADVQDPSYFPEGLEGCYPNSLYHYYDLETKEGSAVAYFYILTNQFYRHESCEISYRKIIADSECNSSNIAELKYIDNEINKNQEHLVIGATAHEAAFIYLRNVYDRVLPLSFNPERKACTLSSIRSKISEIQQASAQITLDIDEMQRITCRMIRENAIVLGRYQSNSQVEIISSLDIRKIVADAKDRDEIYSTSWLRNQKLKGNWPYPTTKGSGRAPEAWDFQALKPFLEKQFNFVDWNNLGR